MTLRNYLQLDGWIPSSKADADEALRKKVLRLQPVLGAPDGIRNDNVRKLKTLIETDPNLYMGFVQMYKEAEPSTVSAATNARHLLRY